MKAICIRCGTSKEAPWHECLKCGHTPEGEDLVKSTYCSVLRFTDDPDREVEYENELCRMSADIQNRHSIEFDKSELKRLRELIRTVEGGSKGALGALFRFFLPAIIFVGILFSIVALLKK